VRLAFASLAVLALAGCGSSETKSLPVLPAAAVPGLSSSTHEVTLRDLGADFGAPASENFEGRIGPLAAGRERVFQGASHRFDRVVSRTLEFADVEAARAYVSFFGAHIDSVFGTGTGKSAISSRGRTGYLIDAASCACHRAEPTLAAVVARATRVTYLEVNGGGATREAVVDLLARAP
jgi:hypothetical protein